VEKIEKLFRKISKEDRKRLLEIVEKLLSRQREGLNIRKVKDSDFYRLRKGRFRIIFHYSQEEIIIDSIKLRNKNTYKKFVL